jgi:hypothetical protein
MPRKKDGPESGDPGVNPAQGAMDSKRTRVWRPGRLSASTIREIRRRIRSWPGRGAPPGSFEELLKIWDLPDEAAVDRAMLESRLRIWIFLLISLIASLALAASGGLLAAMLPWPPAIVGAAGGAWRLGVLRERRWRTFGAWFRESLRMLRPWGRS